MNYRKLFLAIVMILTFTGGFLSGIYFSSNSKQEERQAKVEQKPQTTQKLEKKQTHDVETESAKVLMGYVQDFRDPNTVDYSRLTHVIFSFFHPAKDGSLLFNGDTALTNLRTMVKKAHEYDTKAILSVGGWYHIQGGESYPYFKEAITNPSSRTKLINEIIRMTEQENIDGIDIDFEHPRTKEDAQHLTSFTKELSKQLHAEDKELSIAVNAKVHSITGAEIHNVVYEPAMFEYVDHVNIMAYDGQWDGGYDAANLSPYSYAENIVNYWSEFSDSHHLAKEKLVLGVPFYAQPENPNIKQVSYAAIIHQNPENANQDTVKMNGTTYHYNGTATMQKKTKLALDNGFGGMMLWEVGHDAEGAYSLTAAIAEELEEDQQFTMNQNRSS